MTSRRNQESIYFSDDVLLMLDKLSGMYTTQARSGFVNAAVRYYWEAASQGVDGNLQPLAPGQAQPGISLSRVQEIARVVKQVMDERESTRAREDAGHKKAPGKVRGL